jgi:hypothetical protein
MSDLTEGLEVLIQKAALDGALTQDAVAQFHSLVKERDALKTDNEHYHLKNEQMDKQITKLDARASTAEKCAEEWAGREQDLMDREGKCTELEIRKECADLRVTDHQEMFKTVFRNSVLRKGVMTPVSAGPVDQYGTKQADSYPSHDTVEEEET